MKKKKAHKDFKSVEFMRKRRDEMSELFETDNKEFWKQLEEVRKKYKNKFHKKKIHSSESNLPSVAAEPKTSYLPAGKQARKK